MADTVVLPPDLAERVQARIDAGIASDAVDVIRAGLAALDAEEIRGIEEIRAKIARSLADPRPSVPAEEVFDRIDALIETIAKSR